MITITPTTSPREIAEYIKDLREQEGKEKEVLALINKARTFGHNFVINLFWEEALTYQHLYMNDPTEKSAIAKMQKAVEEAKLYIEKYDLGRWKSRLYRFLGRISDYKGKYRDSVNFYQKSIKYVRLDPEPFRIFELKAFLYFAMIMNGKAKEGIRSSRRLFNDFALTPAGRKLKRSDYQTWAIWRSGIAIKTVGAILDKGLTFNKDDLLNWLGKAEIDLASGDFSYRKTEITKLEERLQS